MEQRPLSPHLQIYRWQLTSVLSITHRLAGGALVVFVLGVIMWLFTLNLGPQAYKNFINLLATWPLKTICPFLVLSLNYYFFSGIRHLCWDMGWGHDLKQVYQSGWLVLILTFLTSFFIWWKYL